MESRSKTTTTTRAAQKETHFAGIAASRDTFKRFAQHQKQQSKTPEIQQATLSQRAPMKKTQLTLTLTNAHTNNIQSTT